MKKTSLASDGEISLGTRNGHTSKNHSKHKKKEDNEERPLTEDELAEREERRREKKNEKRAKKMAEQLEALGLDENGDPLDNFCLSKYPVREWIFKLPHSVEPVALNPVVTLIGVAVLWGVFIWSSVNPSGSYETLAAWRSTVSPLCSSVYQALKAFMFFFLLFLTYKYGHIHMGRSDDKPEFSNLTYFCMTYAAGIGPAALVYGVAEPLLHQTDNFFVNTGYRSQDEKDMFAINMALSNWAITNWIHFAAVGICLAIAVHRFHLPLTFRTCFYPILGNYTWGWIGDFIDGISVVVSIAGACIYMALLASQVTTAVLHLGWVDVDNTEEETAAIHKTTVWIVTVFSTGSLIYGLRGAIQWVSRVAMAVGSLLLILLFFMDDSKFLLNLQVQEVGYFLQTSIFQLNFWTDAFGQLQEGSGRAVDGKAAEQWWMDTWLVFYNAWVLTLAASVGMFYARISRGRKLWEVAVYCFFAPVFYCLIWFCIWGGIGLRQSRQSLELQTLGEMHFNNTAHFLADGSDFCYDVPQQDVIVDSNVVFTNHLPDVTPVCVLDPDDSAGAAYRVFYSFSFPQTFGGQGLGPALSVLLLLGCALYYIACADSATLMVDSLACNGRKNSHWARRMFWACTIGSLTTALSAGGKGSVDTIYTAIVLSSIPFAILLCYLVQSTILFCRAAESLEEDADYQFPSQPEFRIPVYGGVFNALEYLTSWGKVNVSRVELGMDRATARHGVEFLKGIFLPFMSLSQILAVTYPESPMTNAVVTSCYAVCYMCWVSLFFASMALPGLTGLFRAMFVIAGCVLAFVRSGYRSKYNIRSNAIADFTTCTILWPQVLTQLNLQHMQDEKDGHRV